MTLSFITSTTFSKHPEQLFPGNLFLELHQRQLSWEQRVSRKKLFMLWIWSYPVSKKELFLKLADPKKQRKLLKTIWSGLGFYCICKLQGSNFIKNNSFINISQGFSTTCLPPLICRTVKSLIVKAFGYFYRHLYITHLPLLFRI